MSATLTSTTSTSRWPNICIYVTRINRQDVWLHASWLGVVYVLWYLGKQKRAFLYRPCPEKMSPHALVNRGISPYKGSFRSGIPLEKPKSCGHTCGMPQSCSVSTVPPGVEKEAMSYGWRANPYSSIRPVFVFTRTLLLWFDYIGLLVAVC